MTLERRCPPRDQLREFAAGRLPNPPVELEEHILHCESCARQTAELDLADPLVATLRQVKEQTSHRFASDDTALEDLMSACSALWLDQPITVDVTDPNPSAERLQTFAEEATRELSAIWRPAEQPDELGRLANYRILRLLGCGGMGAVFLAEDLQLHRHVALKLIRPRYAVSPVANARFLREARSAAALRHDHIVTIYQVGEKNGVPFLAMEHLEGESLEDRLQRASPLPIADAVRIAREAAEGLAAAHAKGLTHRDIKPANLWLEAGRDRVKLLDFGLARMYAVDQNLTAFGMIVGTPAYMSPEQARGETVDARSDLFSLGCVLYRMLTGKAPFAGRDVMSTLNALATMEAAPAQSKRPDLPAELNRLMRTLLQKSPADRPATAQEVATQLSQLALHDAAPAVDPSGAWQQRANTMLASCLAAGLTLLAVIIITIRNRDGSTTTHRIEAPAGAQVVGVETRDPESDDAKKPIQVFSIGHLSPNQIPETNRAGWFPEEIVAAFGTNQQRHWKGVESVAFHPSGRFFVSSADTLSPAVWSTQSLERITDDFDSEGIGGNSYRLPVFNPNGTRLYAGGTSFDVDLTDPNRPRFRQSTLHVPSGSLGSGIIVFSPAGRWMIYNLGSRLQVLDAADPRCVVREVFPEPPVKGNFTRLELSANGRRVAASCFDGTTHLWNVDWDAEGGPQLTPNGGPIFGGDYGPMALSPDGSEMVAAARLFRLTDSERLPGEIPIDVRIDGESVVFSPDGNWLASLSWRGAYLHVRTETGWKLSHQLNGPLALVLSAGFSPDSKTLVAGDTSGYVHVWDLSVDPPVERNPPPPSSRPSRIVFSPDGRYLATWGLDGGTVWDLTESVPKPMPVRPSFPKVGTLVSFSHDSRWVAFPSGIWEVNRDSPTPDVRIPSGHEAYFSASKPNLIVLTFYGDGDVKAAWQPWSVSTRGKFILHGKTHEFRRASPIRDLAGYSQYDLGTSAAHNRAVTHVKRSIRVWDLDRPESPQYELTAPESLGEAFYCRLSPDGRHLLTFNGGPARIAQLWDLDEPNPQHRPIPGPEVHVAEFLEGSDRLVICQRKTLSVIDAKTGEVLREWALPGPVIWIAAHPDGRHFATVTQNHLVQIWRLP